MMVLILSDAEYVTMMGALHRVEREFARAGFDVERFKTAKAKLMAAKLSQVEAQIGFLAGNSNLPAFLRRQAE